MNITLNSFPPHFSAGHIALILSALLCTFLWFFTLDIRHLVPTDEGRYAEIAREMLLSGDWITVRYNGYKYFEKPPLQIWFTALSFHYFGLGAWQARLYTAVCGFLAIVFVGFTAKQLFGTQAGLYSALVLLASPYWNVMGHFNSLDMGLSFWMAVSLCSLLLAQRPVLAANRRKLWMWLCYAAMACAVLSKGLVGVILPTAVLILYTLIQRDWALWKRLHIASGSLIFLMIAAPWFILIQLHNPEFFDFFFITQQFRRYLTPEQNREGPIYYFIGVLIAGMLPWLSLSYRSLRMAVKEWWVIGMQKSGIRDASRQHPQNLKGKEYTTQRISDYKKEYRSKSEAVYTEIHKEREIAQTTRSRVYKFSPTLVLLIWSSFIFLFYSLSYSKLISYILPIIPALALLIGRALPTLTSTQFKRHLISYLIFLIISAFCALFLFTMGSSFTPNALYRQFAFWLYGALTVTFLGLLVSLYYYRQLPVALSLYAFSWFLFATLAGNGHEAFGKQSSGISLVAATQKVLAQLPPNIPFYSVDQLDHTLPFYLQHTMVMVEQANELRFGIMREPDKWIATIDAWQRQWQQQKYALALITPELYQTLKIEQFPMKKIAEDERRVIISR